MASDGVNTGRKGPVIFQLSALVSVAVGLLLYLVQAFVFKRAKLLHMDRDSGVAEAFLSLAPDLVVALIFGVVVAVLLSREKPLVRRATIVLFVVVVSFFLILQAADYAYFAATGSNLSWAAIDVWLSHTEETNTVIAGDAMSWRLPLVIGQLPALVLLLVIVRVGPLGRRLGGRGALGKGSTISVGALFPVGIVAACLVSPLAGAKMSVSRSVPLEIISQAFHGDEDGAEKGEEVRDILATNLKFEEEADAPRPNIVFILFESLNWKSSDVYTEGRNTTPFLSSIADDSLVVDKHYAVIPHTSKAIMPALCGMYPYMGNKRRESKPDILPRRCAAHILRSQGYRTAFFQPALDFENRSRLVKNMGFHTFAGRDDLPKKGFEKISYFGVEDKAMVKPSMEWVDSVRGESPFFLTYLTLATHHNYVTPVSFPRTVYPEKDADHRNYLNAVRYVDDFIREVFEEFEQRGLMKDTVFIIVGDHGEAFVEHGRRQHDLIMWEEGLRVLSMIHAPGMIEKGGRIEGVRSHLDIVPTICDLLGLKLVNGEFEGSSLLEPPQKNRKLLFSCWFDRQCMAMREGDVKTVFHYDSQPMEVYNNAADEFDEHDLAGELPFDEKKLTASKREMLAWRSRINREYNAWEKDLSEGKISKVKPSVARDSNGVFGGKIRMVGFDVDLDRVAAGGDLRVTHVFEVLEDLPDTVDLFAHVIRGKGPKFVNADHVPVSGSYPVKKWNKGEFITDEYSVHIPTGWAKSTARLSVGFWDKKTGKRLPVSGEGVTVDDNRLVYVEIPVKARKKRHEPTAQELRSKIAHLMSTTPPSEVETPMGATFGDSLELFGVDRTRTNVKLAGTVELTFIYKVVAAIPKGWRMSLRLEPVELGGKAIRGKGQPLGGLLEMDSWEVGEYVTDHQKIHIDMYKSKVGDYRVWLGFTHNGKPVPVEASENVQVDEKGRVMVGEVTINPRTERQ